MSDKSELISKAADLKTLGNWKAWNWLEAQSEPKPATTSAEFRGVSVSAELRKAEAAKLKPLIDEKKVTINDVVKAVEAIGGKVAYAQMQGWLGIKVAPSVKAAPVTVKQSEEVFTISKGERYFYDALLKMVRAEDIAEAKRIVLEQFKEEQMERIEREAQEQMKALNLDSWLGTIEGQDSTTLKQAFRLR
ncbi:hypothetical protein M5Y73_25865 [Citrobacter cronae]|uniref:hypothetical protein n=1 Tax=Citrobacter werkmanii TaxID=67827 RepID=UPI000B41CA12|nr:hypothetical protein [Citrobacter werkmanii]MCL5521607.1 hypothetical protein [Citrobacter cronae]RNW23673.1 hypothetical protein B9081_011630 [Citrobacter werkmanii]